MMPLHLVQALAWLTAAICLYATILFATDRDRGIRLLGVGSALMGLLMVACGLGWIP